MYRSILAPLDGTAMAQHALLPVAAPSHADVPALVTETQRTAPLPVLVCHAAPAARIATLTGGS